MKKFILDFINKIFALQEKYLEGKYQKKMNALNFNKKDSMSKNIMTSGASLTFSVELEKNKQKVRNDVTKLAKENLDNLYNLLEYAKQRGAKFYSIKNAKKLLSLIKEEPGLIFPKKGKEALFINLLTEQKVSFKTDAIFIFEDEKLSIYSLLYEFYKWYSYKMALPGFDEESYSKVKNIDELENPETIETLSYDDIIKLKQAISRDREAMEFVMSFMKEIEGAKKAFENLKDDGANI